MKEMSFEEVREFLFNPNNVHNCEHCPYNDGFDNWQDRLPCGQWHCWVSLHQEE